MRQADNHRVALDHLRRLQAARQSDVDVRPALIGGTKGRSIVAEEAGESHRTVGKVAQITGRAGNA